MIRLAAIHSKTLPLPEEADPHNRRYDPAATERYIENNMKRTFEFFNRACKEKVDLVCTHEDFKGSSAYMMDLDHPEIFTALSEEIPGPTSQKIGEIAASYGVNIAANYYEKDNDKIYNTTVLIGRDGKIVGKYRKIHLPAGERWRVSSGDKAAVFDIDIGKIGFAICYDVIFPEHCRSLALNGADIIIHQTMGWGISTTAVGEAQVRTRAAENCTYMVVSKNIQYDGGKSCILDNYGNILSSADSDEERIVIADIKPDYDMIHEDHFNALFSGVSSVRARLALEREAGTYRNITEDRPPLLDRYEGMRLPAGENQIKEIYNCWKGNFDDSGEKKRKRIEYHW